MVQEKILESLLGCKEIKPVNLKENQPWILIGRTDAKAPMLWPPDAKSQLIGKDLDAGKDWGQEEKGQQELDSITDSMDMNLSKLREIVEDRGVPGVVQSMGLQRVWHDLATEQQEQPPTPNHPWR